MLILSIALFFFAGRKVDSFDIVGNIIRKLRIGWLIKGLWYALLVAFVPGVIWLFGGLVYDIFGIIIAKVIWFVRLPIGIQITVYIISGLCIQGIMYLRKK